MSINQRIAQVASFPTGKPRTYPMRACINCAHIKDLGRDRYECRIPGTYYVKELKGGWFTVTIPHQRGCFKPSPRVMQEHGEDGRNMTREDIEVYKAFLDRYFRRFMPHVYSDNEAGKVT